MRGVEWEELGYRTGGACCWTVADLGEVVVGENRKEAGVLLWLTCSIDLLLRCERCN